MSYRPEDIADALATTLADLPDQELEYALEHQEYFWCSLFKEKNVSIDGGTTIQRKVSFDTSGNARYRTMFDTDEPKFGDSIQTIDVHWALLGTNASWDEFEIVQQRDHDRSAYIGYGQDHTVYAALLPACAELCWHYQHHCRVQRYDRDLR
jgi:hypothetical protein